MTPRESAIEAAAKAIYGLWSGNDRGAAGWEEAPIEQRQYFIERAEASIDAYLAALEAEGGANRGWGYETNGGWVASAEMSATYPSFSVLIIKL
jgi:hypothetical protein